MNAAPVPMAQGGIVQGFSNGGYRRKNPYARSSYATSRMTETPIEEEGGIYYPRGVQVPKVQGSSIYTSGYTPNPYGSEVAIRSLSPSGQNPLSILQTETDAERLNRIFPTSSQKTVSGISSADIDRRVRGIDKVTSSIPGRLGYGIEEGVKGTFKSVLEIGKELDSTLASMGRDVESIIGFFVDPSDDPRKVEEIKRKTLGERRALIGMISRRPDLKDEITRIGASLIGKTNNQEEFVSEVAKSLSISFESGPVLNASGIDDVTSEDQLVTGERYDPPEPVRINQFAVPSGDEESDYIDSVNEMIRVYGESMKSNDPNAQTVFAQELMARTDLTDEFKQAVLQSANEEGGVTEITQDVTTSEPFSVNAAQPPVETSTDPFTEAEKRLLESPIEEDAGGLDYEAKSETDANAALRRKPETGEPPVPEGSDEYGTREGLFGTYMGDEDSAEDLLSGELRQKIGDFEGKKTKEENERNMKFFMDRFKEAVPEYKGMSESEKWFSVAEAGLRIMAGKSPNAITNIAEGLKGLGAEFAKDAKERRAYDRQINLSAAKYALEGMEKLRTEERALAAEGRKRPYKLVAMEAFTYEGQNFKKGQAFPATEQQIRDGLFKKLPVTFTETFIADAKATAAAAKKALGGRTSAEAFTKVQGKYLDDLDNFKSGVRMKAVLRESARLATSGEVLGGTALLKDYANKAMNSLGIQMKDRTKFLQKYSSTAREDYSAKQKRLGTLMATQLLRESSKTLSDYDRKRVEELIGALTGVGESLWASEDVLKDRLINLEMSIDDGIRRSSNSMLATEDLWRREVTKGGTAIFPVLLDARRRGLGQTTQLGGSSRAKSYLLSDIYNLKTKKFKKGFLSGVNK
tara:strand:- start:2010 stop:4601 length:2592 start_codon:yes stop_codon:yes gene_type:complete